jgi:hypothetical protein
MERREARRAGKGEAGRTYVNKGAVRGCGEREEEEERSGHAPLL